MPEITVVLLGAGSGSRFCDSVKKQWLRIGDEPLWEYVAHRFETLGFSRILLVAAPEDYAYMRKLTDLTLVAGGESRQESLKNALEKVETEYVLVSDIARCCIDEAVIGRITETKGYDCVVPYLSVNDTVYLGEEPVDREQVKLIQTPQMSKTKRLQKALESQTLFTDDSGAIKADGGSIRFVEGSKKAHKLTRVEDLAKLECLQPPSERLFTGTGFDIHAFEKGKPMYLCGMEVASELGFKAHSDGDVAIHALIDALLGAAGMGDIGELYPDTDPAFAGADSKVLLQDVLRRIKGCGFVIDNLDMTIIAQVPKLQPYKEAMGQSIKELTKCKFVNIKATTAEKMGFIGRKEGVAVQAVATLRFYRWER